MPTHQMARINLQSMRFWLALNILLMRPGLRIRAEDCDAGKHVTEMKVNNASTTSISLSWKDSLSSTTCLDKFTVSWCNVPEPWFMDCTPETHNLTTDDTEYVLTGLQPCSYYWVAISAERQSGLISRSQDLVITSSVANEVRNLEVSHLGERHYAVSWDVEGDDSCIESYRICWQAEEMHEECDHTSYSNYDFYISRLDACSNYTVSVASLALGNAISENITTYFLTGPDNVANLSVNLLESDSALVSWYPPPSSCADHYTLSWCLSDIPNGTCNPISTYKLKANVSHFNIPALEPCIYYVISISTQAADGRPSTSSRVTVIKELYDFGPPSYVEVSPVNSKQFTMYYGPPINATYCVTDYIGCFKEAGTTGEPTCSHAFLSGFWSNDDSPTKACTNYDVTLTAISKDNKTSSISLSLFSPPDPVVNLNLMNSSSVAGGSSVIVTWELSPDNTCMTYQHIRYSNFNQELWVNDVNLTRDVTSYVITDMSPCTEYMLEVVEEPFSSTSNTTVIYFSTASNVTTVSEMKVDAADEHSINISYTVPVASLSCVSGYSVCWRQTTTDSDTCHTDKGAGVKAVYIEDFANCTSYTVSVTLLSPCDDIYNATTLTTTTTGCSNGAYGVPRADIVTQVGLFLWILFFQKCRTVLQ